MPEKVNRRISLHLENRIYGLLNALICLVLIINMGVISRTFAFPFIYFFGQGYYLFLGFFLFKGIYRLLLARKFKFKKIIYVFGLIALFISALFVIGYIWANVNNYDFSLNGFDALNKYNEGLGHYYQNQFLNLFEPGSFWSNGVIFLTLESLLGYSPIILALAIIFFLLGMTFILLPFFVNHHTVAKKTKKVAKEKKADAINAFNEQQRADIDLFKEMEMEEDVIPQPSINNFEPEPVEAKYGFEPEEDVSSRSDNFSPISLDEVYSQKENKETKNVSPRSEFTRLAFSPFGTVKIEEPAQSQPIKEEISSNYDNEIIDTPIIEDSAPIRTEDEEIEKPKIDEELVKIAPSFQEPINVVKAEPKIEEPIETFKLEVSKKKERVNWIPPSSDLLSTYEVAEATEINVKTAEARKQVINEVLSNFKIRAKCNTYTIGSSVTRFNVEYDADVSVKSVEKYVDDISLRLGGVDARFTPIVTGESFSGLEIPNATITTVSFKEVFEELPDVKKHPLSVAFGKDISGNVVYADFDEFPHLLVAGTTGSGKSIYVHSIIATLIMRVSPDDLKIVLVDPKKVEMTKYRDMPHLLCPIITEAEKAKVMLSKLVDEMNNRYDQFAAADYSSNIKQYNEWAKSNNRDPMPYIVIVLDEYADLIDTCKEISQPVVSIAQKARAAGIHLLISTQRPSTNVITGVIKGNLPTHVALMTSNYTDSMTILSEGGAEKLLGKGDMLVQCPLVSKSGAVRLQGCYVQNREIAHIVGYLKEHYETNYDENYLDLVDHSKEAGQAAVASGEVEKEQDAAEEAKYQSIKEWVMSQQFVSMSKIQRECGVGFNRAGRFFNRLQKEGVVSTQQDGATKGCKVLQHDSYYDDSPIVTSGELID